MLDRRTRRKKESRESRKTRGTCCREAKRRLTGRGWWKVQQKDRKNYDRRKSRRTSFRSFKQEHKQ